MAQRPRGANGLINNYNNKGAVGDLTAMHGVGVVVVVVVDKPVWPKGAVGDLSGVRDKLYLTREPIVRRGNGALHHG